MAARAAAARGLVVPAANAAEAALVEGLPVWGAQDLREVLAVLQDPAQTPQASAATREPTAASGPDLVDVRGQPHGRRALEIAAAGGHHLLLVGAAGSGKTMLARRLPGLLPPLAATEALELTRLHSVAGLLVEGGNLISQRPFRSPHHSCSGAALIGGGTIPMPGEVSLAHHGVLFLDELAEFRRDVLDQLRQPLEEGDVLISRTRQRCRFPCRITLVAATNPCPCGRYGEADGSCDCGESLRRRYWSRLSGPLLDRLDLQVVMRRPPARELAQGIIGSSQRAVGDTGQREQPETSAVVAQRVRQARARMAGRNPGGGCNAQIASESLPQVLDLEERGRVLWERAMEQRRLSARGGMRLLRVARTIADLAGHQSVGTAAIAEALTFRSFDLVSTEPMAAGRSG
jgi:magnesium chelatase family protein